MRVGIIRPVRHSTNQYASDNYGDGMLMKVAASDGSQQGTATLGSSLARAAFDGANVWLANQSSNTVRKLRASDPAIPNDAPEGNLVGPTQFSVNADSHSVTKQQRTQGATHNRFAPSSTNPCIQETAPERLASLSNSARP